jgi:hypothetical protein
MKLANCKYLNTKKEKHMLSQFEIRESLLRVSFLRIGIIVLAALTAAVHFYLAYITFVLIAQGPLPPGATAEALLPFASLFLLNGIGYLVLVAALYMSRLQRFQWFTRLVLIGYTLLTIVAWYVLAASRANLFDYSDKLIEAGLIVLLLIEGRQTRQSLERK